MLVPEKVMLHCAGWWTRSQDSSLAVAESEGSKNTIRVMKLLVSRGHALSGRGTCLQAKVLLNKVSEAPFLHHGFSSYRKMLNSFSKLAGTPIRKNILASYTPKFRVRSNLPSHGKYMHCQDGMEPKGNSAKNNLPSNQKTPTNVRNLNFPQSFKFSCDSEVAFPVHSREPVLKEIFSSFV